MSSSDRTPRERLDESLKTPYPADGQVWNALLSALAAEFEAVETVREEVLAAKFVTTATGDALERLASIFELERRTDEPDSLFRLRVQTALRAQLSSGRINDIRETIAVLLGADVTDIAVDEPLDIEPARIDVSVFESQLEAQGLSVADFFREVEPLTASGVAVEGFARGTFEHAAAGEDPTDADRGYGTLDDDSVGGTYSALLQ